MFIPLSINNKENGELKNIIIAGDTAGIFWVLSHITRESVNVFLCDTGIRRPLREFPHHHATEKDRANVYYDFFDGAVGAGIYRRMDAVITSSHDAKNWCRQFHVPHASFWQDPSGTWLEVEGTSMDLNELGREPVQELLARFLGRAADGHYEPVSQQVLLDREDIVHVFPAVERWDKGEPLKPIENACSAWDRALEVLGNNEVLQAGEEEILPDEERRLIELGIPELDVLKVRHADGILEYRELNGDLHRVFDGLFEK